MLVLGYDSRGNLGQHQLNVGRTGVATYQPIGSLPGASGSSVHQTREWVQFGGQWVDVAIQFFCDVIGTPTVVADSVITSPTNFTTRDPDSAWITTSGLTVPAAASTTAWGWNQTPWTPLYVQPDAGNPNYGTITRRSVFTSGGRFIGTNAGVNYGATVTGNFKSILDYNVQGAIATAFGANPSGADIGFRSSKLLIRPRVAGRGASTLCVGDSRKAGDGDTNNFYGFCHRTAESIADVNSRPLGFENLGVSGSDSTSFLTRLQARLSGGGVDLVHWQPASSNDANAWDSATVDTCLARTATVADLCRRQGIAFVTEKMYASVAANTAAKAEQWRRLNTTIGNTYSNVVDFSVFPFTVDGTIPVINPALTADGQHFIAAGQILEATATIPVWRYALNI